MSKATPGFYSAKLNSYKLTTDKNNSPRLDLEFCVALHDGTFDYVRFDGNFNNEVGIDIALKVLATLGLENGDDIYRLSEGIESGLLNTLDDVRVKVVVEHGKDGRQYTKVKGVYHPGSEQGPKVMAPEEAQNAFAALNLGASFAQIKSEMPKPEASTAETAEPVPF